MRWLRTLARLIFGDWRHVTTVTVALLAAWLAIRVGHPAWSGASIALVLLGSTAWLA